MFCPVFRVEWKPISMAPIKNNMYMISNKGEIKNIHTGNYISSREINTGYISVNLRCIDNTGRNFLLHRLVAFHFVERSDIAKNTVNHKDGNKKLYDYYNLEWVTQGENNNHAKRIGLNNSYAENHYASLLTNEQVITICELLEKNYQYKDILDYLGMDSSNPTINNNYDLIGNIRRGIAWKSISKDYTFPKYNYNAMYPNEQIHLICKYIEAGKDISFIYEQITGQKYTNSIVNKTFYEFVRRIKSRQQMIEISCNYNW